MGLKWWEKTVEYKFVMLIAKEEKLFLAPLDDKQERAGDAIFSSDNKWLLIEFKKNSESIKTEKDKFNDYDAASTNLSSQDQHHHIVYGSEIEKHLKLNYQTYFSDIHKENLSAMLASGIEFSTFKTYIKNFTAFKKLPAGASGSGGLNTDDFAMVAGVNNENNIVECMSLTEFKQEYNLELANEQILTNEYKGPSFGR